MKFRHWIMATAVVVPALAAYGEDANKIMMEVAKRSAAAKTMSATMITEQTLTGGPMGSRKTTTTMLSKKPNLVYAKVVGSGPMAANATIVSDGKFVYFYMPAQKQYRKSPAPKDAESLTGGGIANLSKLIKEKGATFTYVKKGTWDGRPVHIISAKFKKNMGGGLDMTKANTTIYVGVNDYIVYGMKMALPLGQQGGGMTANIAMHWKNVKTNIPIPDSKFRWTPPPGVTEMAGGPGGRMGAGPGPSKK